jgi:hypothetical protein
MLAVAVVEFLAHAHHLEHLFLKVFVGFNGCDAIFPHLQVLFTITAQDITKRVRTK